MVLHTDISKLLHMLQRWGIIKEELNWDHKGPTGQRSGRYTITNSEQ